MAQKRQFTSTTKKITEMVTPEHYYIIIPIPNIYKGCCQKDSNNVEVSFNFHPVSTTFWRVKRISPNKYNNVFSIHRQCKIISALKFLVRPAMTFFHDWKSSVSFLKFDELGLWENLFYCPKLLFVYIGWPRYIIV
jgi:glycosidase